MSKNENDDDIFSEKEKQVEIDPNPLATALDELNDLLEKEKQKSLRLLADYQNLEKQTIDKINARGDKIILDFLTVYEDFIRTKDAYEKEGGNVDSLNGIIKNMVTILDHYEVKPIEAEGKKLDPKLHEVVQEIEDNDHEEGTVVKEITKGYIIRDEVIKYSKVCVSKKLIKKKVKNLAERIIGIDLGTSNSAAAIIQGGKPTIIPSAEGQTAHGKAFPSVVAFPKDGSAMLVGTPAVNQAVTNPENTITKAKRKMGTDHVYKIEGKEYKPQQISAFILQKIKKDAEAFTGDKITKAVITVPAYFDDNQRQATKDAGTIAGLDVARIINEPTAAALAFGLDKAKQDMKILVFDFGGGTLDVTIMEMGGGGFEVMSTSGDTKLGGTDMD